MKESKQLDIELMRILAAIFVIFNHIGYDNGFFLFSRYDKDSLEFWLYLMPSIFCKFAVPLFFAIAGALLLNREPEPIPKLWVHRVLKIAVILVVWSFFYYLVEVIKAEQSFSLKTFALTLYGQNWNYSFWYLYAYIPFLISLPLLQRFVKELSNRDFLYLGAVYLLFWPVLQTAQYLLLHNRVSMNGYLRPDWISSQILFFPCLGYFLRYRIRDYWNGKRLAVLWLVNLAALLLACWMTYREAAITGVCNENVSQGFHRTFEAVYCTTVFVSCQYLFDRVKPGRRLRALICSLGSCTLGIYLLHVLFIYKIPGSMKLLELFRQQWHINPMVSAFLYDGCIFLTGYLVTLLLKRIPILKKLV